MQNHTIWLKLHTPYLEKPISASREDAENSLLEKNKNSSSKLICVDGTNFSDEIKIVNDEIIKDINSVLLLPAWFDWIVAKTSSQTELALPVWDCGLLVAFHKDLENLEKIIGNAHLGYKWVIADWDLEKNGIIENFLNSLKNASNSEKLNDFKFFLAPMAWQNFELPKNYFYAKIAPFIEKQNKTIKTSLRFAPEKFIKKSPNIYNDNNGERVYFDLKSLILYLLKNKYSINISSKNIDERSTTNPNNTLSSFRSYIIAKNIGEEVFALEINEKNFFDIAKKYNLTKEQMELLLSWNANHYKNTNSRLSLNIFTK